MFESFPFINNNNSINGTLLFDDDNKTIVQFSSTLLSLHTNFIQRVSPIIKKVLCEIRNSFGNRIFVIARIMFGNIENESSPIRVGEFNFDSFTNTIVSSDTIDTGHVILEFYVQRPIRRHLWQAPSIYYDDESGYNSDESL